MCRVYFVTHLTKIHTLLIYENKMDEHYYINIADVNLNKILLLSKYVEERYNNSVLTGICFAHTHDNKYLLGLAFTSKPRWLECLTKIKRSRYERIYTQEEQWLELSKISKYCVVGNFSHVLLTSGKK